ncbi:MAG: DUF2007 domain-containing protein [Phycisphaerae bacterium]|nr:DUF2007 domain-containing protein [Phycisphaerae bacterium]
MAGKIITIAEYDNYIEAEMAKQTLEDQGITAIVAGANAANIYSVPAVAKVQLQVLEGQAEEAKRILEDMSQAADIVDEDIEDE